MFSEFPNRSATWTLRAMMIETVYRVLEDVTGQTLRDIDDAPPSGGKPERAGENRESGSLRFACVVKKIQKNKNQSRTLVNLVE